MVLLTRYIKFFIFYRKRHFYYSKKDHTRKTFYNLKVDHDTRMSIHTEKILFT